MAKKTSRPHHACTGTAGALTRLCFNALAFSTLLSSQETGAHHQPAFARPPGQPLNFTRGFHTCQLGVFRKFPDTSLTVKISRTQHTRSPRTLHSRTAERNDPRSWACWGVADQASSRWSARVSVRRPACRPSGLPAFL